MPDVSLTKANQYGQRNEEDRREADPPIQVKSATSSRAGQLDWWVKERWEWWGRVAAQRVVYGGYELSIFVPRGPRP
jgi:hypothetical protein